MALGSYCRSDPRGRRARVGIESPMSLTTTLGMGGAFRNKKPHAYLSWAKTETRIMKNETLK